MKDGTLPLFLTVFQQTRNAAPQPRSNGFSVRTYFAESGGTVSVLHAGKSAEMRITVEAQADAEYVMIEVPIPAGCAYESRSLGRLNHEIHREHFKDRVSIFCSRLPQGSHEFTVKLIPRFTGRYTLNPASAELMYFPTFSGRGGHPGDLDRVATGHGTDKKPRPPDKGGLGFLHGRITS